MGPTYAFIATVSKDGDPPSLCPDSGADLGVGPTGPGEDGPPHPKLFAQSLKKKKTKPNRLFISYSPSVTSPKALSSVQAYRASVQIEMVINCNSQPFLASFIWPHNTPKPPVFNKYENLSFPPLTLSHPVFDLLV